MRVRSDSKKHNGGSGMEPVSCIVSKRSEENAQCPCLPRVTLRFKISAETCGSAVQPYLGVHLVTKFLHLFVTRGTVPPTDIRSEIPKRRQ
jgi:hypothetical protein